MFFTDQQLERYARVLIWGLATARERDYRKNDIVLIRYDQPATPLAEVVQASLLEAGLQPVLRTGLTPRMEVHFYKKSNEKQLTFTVPGDRELCEKLHGSIYLYAPESLTHLSDADPRKIAKAIVARKPLRDILEKRDQRGLYGWTLCMFPTDELARYAQMSLRDYTEQVVRACYLDVENPVRQWETVHREIGRIKKWLNGMSVAYYHVESENIDLKIAPGQRRRWVGVSGHNIPSFEIFISPDWRGTEGTYYADQPSYRTGNFVRGIRLTFRKGKVVEAKAEVGENFAVKQLAMDDGARKVGEFSLTDRRFSRINRFMANTLFDENYGGRYGNCHLAVGSSYADSYAGNPAKLTGAQKKKLGFNDSALHWDLVNTDRKRVTAHLVGGGRIVIYDEGVFKY
ncbi:MAG TPA: aminopeptidase [Syntrophales bacterium]|nr:aminopeptidase [Syntrophales bacterium]HOX95472.1 aminopeptidase [Syntrophales bacterium]HPI55790.1 aminopeptidase [Syntrophales bacterium]HPN23718.1 aminopeptidase [Syntrophales bacterium]HQM27756.1 aminopeptidase [Syntrophales bacterium]